MRLNKIGVIALALAAVAGGLAVILPSGYELFLGGVGLALIIGCAVFGFKDEDP